MTSHTDLNYLNEMTGGDQSVAQYMFGVFQEQVEELRENLKKHLQEKDWTNLSKVAHKSKSSITIMGMNDLATKMSELEKMSKTGSHVEKYEEYIQHFNAVCDEAITELRQKLEIK